MRRATLSIVAMGALGAVAGAQTTGFTPLMDLGTGQYQGYEGGLYPGGVNTPPAAHAAAALAMSQQIVPRDAAGNPDPAGVVGFIAIGMSNTTHEFSVFERQEDLSTVRNAQVVLLDTAYGGQDSVAIRDPAAPYWTTLSRKVAAMGMTPAQVQVAWLKEATANPANDFPGHAQRLRDDEKAIARILHDSYPNLRICYVSSRIFGGYATGGLNPEPQAYEGGFSVKWLIEDQINGDPTINYDPANGTVEAPLLLWGPYLWADGVNPRSDGLVWLPQDLENDGVHPSTSGEQKVADLLSAFFPGEPSAQAWWWSLPGYELAAIDVTDDAHVRASVPGGNFGSDPTLVTGGGSQPTNAYLMFDATAIARPVRLAKLSLRVSAGMPDAVASAVGDDSWDETTITFANAPTIFGKVADLRTASRDGSLAGDVTTAVNGDADGIVSLAMTTTAAGQGDCVSKDAGQPPRLVMIVTSSSQASLDIVAGMGPAFSNPNQVMVLDGAGQPTGVDFLAYGANQYGVNVAAGDIDGGLDEIVTGPGPGSVFGPQCRAFDRVGIALAKVNFFAYGTLRFGVNVAVGNLDGDATREIVTGPGPGSVFGPHVRGFDYDGVLLSPISKVTFYAYGTLRYGVNVRSGSIDADVWDEIETGPGPGSIFGAQVRGFDYDGTVLRGIAAVNFLAFATPGYGVNLAVGEADGDAFTEIACAPGPGSGAGYPARFLGYGYDGAAVGLMPGYDVVAFATLYGGRPSLADFDQDAILDLAAGAGPDPAAPSGAEIYVYDGSTLTQIGLLSFGAGAPNAASGSLGY